MSEIGKYYCYHLKSEKIFGVRLQFSLSYSYYIGEMRPCYPDSHVLNQSSVVIVTADDVGPAAPVSLCVHSRPSVNT